ncbi:MAG: nucleoside 2-deoxyribosyltransferase [Nitrosomonas sp.]|nr:nucleoside 2-deoxyribosyltransferase [Nitrosomonas sp.]
MSKQIYFAAPLFTQAERIWNQMLANAIVGQYPEIKVFLPQKESNQAIYNGKLDFARVQKICLNGIDTSDVLVAILDGPDSDSGTCFECGYAFSKGKKIIGIRTDLRAGEDQGLNAMLNQSCTEVIHCITSNASENQIAELGRLIVASVNRVIS